jgi:hypothetical protein
MANELLQRVTDHLASLQHMPPEYQARAVIKAVAEWLKAEDQAETSEARRLIFKALKEDKTP